ncbi:calcium-dependent phosphotriesterase [Melanomma pulvis-pyrius CBS 109.77]|uniref:Calcium-dependent phosphotriesterase n=1 Tax=Melanomma pulvis-pyrius CBS 109.77 TaxID=1314802 RepID=A0A6A6X5V5_9PLEO|nr:calcium-dependent phosphotriesterase [Melanomma pulvis-pyrius CBS 109.77]
MDVDELYDANIIQAGAHVSYHSASSFTTIWKTIITTLVKMSSIVPVDLLAGATNPAYFSSLATTNISNPTTISLLAYHSNFSNVLGAGATARQLYNLDWQAFHEMGTYNRETNSVYITSNYVSLDNPINITIIDIGNNYSLTSTRFDGVHEANGGTNWYPPDTPQTNTSTPPRLLFCDEGDFNHASALVSVDPTTRESTVVLNSFLGRNFSSVNDVRQHPATGDLWFTDADYGFFQAFRPPPAIPKQVYRFDARTGEIQVVADGFDQSNGLEFSPDLKTLYVTDTGAQHFAPNLTRPATIYAFDVTEDAKRLVNRRTFAYADVGFPDGIHTDLEGNVWAGCGDGVHVWSPEGVLLGKIWVGVVANNFAFLPGAVLVFSNAQLWVVEGVKAVGREICRDFGTC